MRRPDKSAEERASNNTGGTMRLVLVVVLLGLSAACNRMATPPAKQLLKDADGKAAEGDFIQAISLYETALDGSAKSADVHYKMALLYDDKMNDPLNAMHHFKRYLTLAPGGSHAAEVKNYMKRDELTLVTTLSGDSVVSRGEAARLKNENLTLRHELEEKIAQAKTSAASDKLAAKKTKTDKSAEAGKKSKSGPRSHVVKKGETLFSLSRKYYKSPDRWKDIRDANGQSVDDSGKLKAGATVTIP